MIDGTGHEGRFSLVLMLSLTMWIHINAGDQGLIEFLERVARVADNIIVEPQPWKCCMWLAGSKPICASSC